MRQAISKNLFKGFRVGKENIEVNLLQCVDDIVFFREPTTKNVTTIKSMASGLKVNFFKSYLGTVRVDTNTLGFFANILNCRLMIVPFVYLGVLVEDNLRREETGEQW